MYHPEERQIVQKGEDSQHNEVNGQGRWGLEKMPFGFSTKGLRAVLMTVG